MNIISLLEHTYKKLLFLLRNNTMPIYSKEQSQPQNKWKEIAPNLQSYDFQKVDTFNVKIINHLSLHFPIIG